MEKIHLSIDGMSCGHCVSRVRTALAGVKGVRVEDVRVGAADVEFDPQQTSAERITASITDLGFDAQSSETRAA
jgi:copper chaperone CopZ